MDHADPIDAPTSNEPAQPLPPQGDSAKAEQYLNQITNLISQDNITVVRTDLKKFDPSTFEDHYRIELAGFHVEVSHCKQPNSGKDSYIILFTNIKRLKEGCTEKIILAYMNLSPVQFQDFKNAAEDQIERKRRAEEERRFKEAMAPIDEILNNLSTHEDPAKTIAQVDTDSSPHNSYFS